MLLATLLVLVTGGPPDDATPSLATVRAAMKQNAERIKNRRVKYVKVKLAGTPQRQFPPLDHPDRVENETTIAADARWRNEWTMFRANAAVLKEVYAWDGCRQTTLAIQFKDGKVTATAKISSDQNRSHVAELMSLELNVGRWQDGGIRARVKAAPSHPGFIQFTPYEDDRSPTKLNYVLDPSKNYWPVRYDHEDSRPGRSDKNFHEIHEFQQTPAGWYPKRVSDSYGFFITVTATEFPASFSDAAFTVAIPEGARVRDQVANKEYYQGGEEIIPPARAPVQPPGLLDRVGDLVEVPVEDWLVYGGFVAAVSALVGTVWYLLAHPQRKPPGANGSASTENAEGR
jgi:hypothetical protein